MTSSPEQLDGKAEGGFASEKTRDGVFTNDLIWSHLGTYLNHADLKDCRLVSRDFNKKVMEATGFKSRSVMVLTGDRLNEEGFGMTREKWKHMKIVAFKTVTDDPVDLSWFDSHLSEVETLLLSAGVSWDDSESTLVPSLIDVLAAAKSLRRLTIDQQFLNQSYDNSQFVSCPKIQNAFKTVTELQLISFLGRPMYQSFPCNFGKWMDAFTESLRYLTGLSTSAIIPEDALQDIPRDVDEELHAKVQNLLQLVEVNKEHITTLRLDDMQLWSTSMNPALQSLPAKVFPNLKVAKIRMRQSDTPYIIKFFEQQPPLEDIDISIMNTCSGDLIKAIRSRSSQLKRFSLKTKAFDRIELNTWSFLSQLKHLEEFNLHLVSSFRFSMNSEYPPAVLSSLPKSIKRISLRGLPSSFDWDAFILPESLSALDPYILTELSISRCGGSVNDEVLEFICRTFLFLRLLNISNTDHNCTDYGFTGIPSKPDSEPFSLSDLRGLRSLTLRSCGTIGDMTLVHGVKFQELRYLDVSNNPHITEEGCQAVLKQNPSLEIFRTSEFDSFASEEDLMTLHHRLKEHQYSDGGDSDDDDASENHHGIGSDSSLSGGGCDYSGYDEDYDDDAYEYYDDDDANFDY